MSLETGRVIERIIIVLCVPLLVVVGYKLFVLGVTGKMEITAKMSAVSAKITSVAPGGLCFVLAVSLGAYSMFSKLTEGTKTSTSVTQSSDPGVSISSTDAGNSQQTSALQEVDAKSHLPISGASRITQKTVSTTTEKTESDLGPTLGSGASLGLSHRLRVAVDDLFFCGEGAKDDAASEVCRTIFNRKFKRLPTPDDITGIEKAETEMRSNRVDTQKHGQDEYSKSVRAFDR